MLPKKERLKISGLFTQAYQKGKPVYSKNLVITFTATLAKYKDQLPFVGFVVSTGFSKKATLRNRVKRQLREIYRLYRLDPEKQIQLKKIGLLVISIKKNFVLQKYSDIEKEFNEVLDKILYKL